MPFATTTFPAHMVLPLLSGLVYVAGALLLKRAGEQGANAWRTTRTCNYITAAVFAPLLLLGGKIPSAGAFYQPALVALFFVVGQVFTILSLRIGDVSVATPVLALKILLVAVFTTLLIGDRIAPALWIAATLSTLAVGLLQFSGASSHRNLGATILCAGMAASCYALVDVHVQKWSPAWGAGRFLPATMGIAALLSLGLRFSSAPQAAGAREYPTRWVIGGALCLAVQAVMLVSTIAIHGHATMANVLYSSRGLWSVVAVWLAGKWFGNLEHRHGTRVLAWRFCGAALLLAAIIIVLVGKQQG